MRSIASLNLELGLLSIPLKVCSLGDGKGLSFNLTCPDCKEQIQQKRVCPKCKKEIAYGDLARSIKIGDQRFMIGQDLIDNLKNSEKSIELIGVVTDEQIEKEGYGKEFSMITKKNYGLLPKESFEKQYCFLHSLLNLSGKKLLVKFSIRQKSHLGLVKTFGKHLFISELIYPEYYNKMPDYNNIEMNKEELKLGLQLLNQFTSKNVVEVKDTYAEKVGQYISGDLKIPVEKKVEKTSDMLQLLNASLVKDMKKEVVKKV